MDIDVNVTGDMEVKTLSGRVLEHPGVLLSCDDRLFLYGEMAELLVKGLYLTDTLNHCGMNKEADDIVFIDFRLAKLSNEEVEYTINRGMNFTASGFAGRLAQCLKENMDYLSGSVSCILNIKKFISDEMQSFKLD